MRPCCNSTHLYASDHLIVRRGQEFQLKVSFDHPYKPSDDQFAVEFVIGGSTQFSKGTYILVSAAKDRQSPWAGRVVDSTDNVVTVGITPAPDCIVGKWRTYVAVVTPYGIRRTRRDETDSVFLDDDEEREECVLNEVGVIYHGAYDHVSERPWNFDQFDYGVLDTCLFIMDKAAMPITNRGDAIKVARKASAMILLNYYSSKMPVCYAQCWVYAAVLNTFLRCLGIPIKVVTNFYSAHDNDGNLKTDELPLLERVLHEQARPSSRVWGLAGCGCYTPGDQRWCGPASVQAIKHGQICFPFDAPFVFAEVNSDVVFYSRNPRDGTLEPVRVNSSHVGRMVVTKVPGQDARRDITDQDLIISPSRLWCPTSTGSPEERTVLEKAEEYGCHREKATPPEADVELDMPLIEVRVWDDFELKLEFNNTSDQVRTVDVYISGNVVYYTEVTSSEFLFKTPRVILDPKKAEKQVMEVRSQE
ncbi:unnamed protein product [Coregonus sp. 'balchen']|nr:unnamed protein product [Coregonus sp. 'balchen']